MPRRRFAPLPLAASALVLVALVGGCSGSGGDKAGSNPTIAPETTAAGPYSCESVEPGIVVDSSEAIVLFDSESMCPGWVTVEQGTPVTFTNKGSAEATVVITATQLPGSAEVARFTLAAGASQPFDTLDVAMMGFSTSSLPAFRGTIEVVGPDGGMQH